MTTERSVGGGRGAFKEVSEAVLQGGRRQLLSDPKPPISPTGTYQTLVPGVPTCASSCRARASVLVKDCGSNVFYGVTAHHRDLAHP